MNYKVESETKYYLVVDFVDNRIRIPVDEYQKNIKQDQVVDLLVEYFQDIKIFEKPDEIIFYAYDQSVQYRAKARIPWKNEYSGIHKDFQIDGSNNTGSKEVIREIVKYFCNLD